MKQIFFIFSVIFVIIQNSCTITYSTSGASISPDVRTVSIQYFKNQTTNVNPTLSQDFTEKFKQKFIDETDLRVVNDKGHLNFEGEITGYSTEPMSIGDNQQAMQNKLTVTIKIRYNNEKDDKYNYDKSFSDSDNYLSSKNLDEASEEILPDIIDRIIDKAFNEAVANW